MVIVLFSYFQNVEWFLFYFKVIYWDYKVQENVKQFLMLPTKLTHVSCHSNWMEKVLMNVSPSSQDNFGVQQRLMKIKNTLLKVLVYVLKTAHQSTKPFFQKKIWKVVQIHDKNSLRNKIWKKNKPKFFFIGPMSTANLKSVKKSSSTASIIFDNQESAWKSKWSRNKTSYQRGSDWIKVLKEKCLCVMYSHLKI